MHVNSQYNNSAIQEAVSVSAFSVPTFKCKEIPYLEYLMPFFNPQDICALAQVNKLVKKQATVDLKKFRYITEPSSLLTACRVQNLLRNTEEKPITWKEILRLVEIERLLNIKITPFSSIYHLEWNELENSILQRAIRCVQACPIESLSENVALLATNPRKSFLLSREMQLISIQVEKHELTQLKNYKALRKLTLRTQNGIDPHDPAQIASLAGTLKSLCLHLSPASEDVCLQALSQLTELTHLELGCLRKDAHLSALSNLTSLECLSFIDGQITGENLNALARLTVLHTLKFTKCKDLSTSHVLQLVHLTALQNLSFTYGCPLNTEELGRFTTLRNLTIYKSTINDDDLPKLNTLCNLQTLTLVPRASYRHLTISGLNQLNGLTALRELNLRDIELDENESLDSLWDHLPALQDLHVTAFRTQEWYDENNHPKSSCRIKHEDYTRPKTL